MTNTLDRVPGTDRALSEEERQALQAYSPQAWLLSKGALTNKGRPMEWIDRLWQHEILIDQSPEQAIRKASQVGCSTIEIFKVFWQSEHRCVNTIYVLPNDKLVTKFVRSKVNPIMRFNHIPTLDADSVEMKSIGTGDRMSFVFFQGSWTDREAISVDADILIFDEEDFCKPNVLGDYESRVNASDLAWKHHLSTPTFPNQAIDYQWERSDQKHWFVKCENCGHEWYMDWPDNVCYERQVYQCAKCHAELSRNARRGGRWVAKWENMPVSGFWVNQQFCAWIDAADLIEKEKRLGKQHLYNYCLGKPYAGTDISISEGLITHALRSGEPDKKTPVCVGVDVGGTTQHHVTIGPPAGVTEILSISWDETDGSEGFDRISNIIRHYDTRGLETVVIDGNPKNEKSRKLAEEWPYKVYLSFFSDADRKVTPYDFDDEKQNVINDRHQTISLAVEDLRAGRLGLYLDSLEPEFSKFKRHWSNVFLQTVTDKNGNEKQQWANGGNPDHYALATGYLRLAHKRFRFADPDLRTERSDDEVIADPNTEPDHPVFAVKSESDDSWYYG